MASEIITRAEASARGLTRYFTGEPCKQGHVAPRQCADAKCVQCVKIKHKRWRDANPEKMKAWGKTQAAKPESKIKARAKSAEYRAKSPDKSKAEKRAWYWANAEKCRAATLSWRKANPDRQKASLAEWNKRNPEATRVYQARRRAWKATSAGKFTLDELKALAVRQNYKCAGCRTCIRRKYHADHIHPLSKGGSNFISNIQLLCVPCNQNKHAKDPIAWAQEHGRLL